MMSPEIDEDRESAYALLRRGQELLAGRHHAQAAVVLERALRLEPRKGSIVEALARACYGSGQDIMAVVYFEQLLRIDPSNAYGHLMLGLSLKRLAMYEEARAHLRLAAVMDPQNELCRRVLDVLEHWLAPLDQERAAKGWQPDGVVSTIGLGGDDENEDRPF
jgi:tetratricopeptide (TPR) repeat protein